MIGGCVPKLGQYGNAHREVSVGMEGPESLTVSVDVLCYGILVNKVLVDILRHKLVYHGRYPGLQESQIQLRLAVQRELVVNDLIRGLSIDTLWYHRFEMYEERQRQPLAVDSILRFGRDAVP